MDILLLVTMISFFGVSVADLGRTLRQFIPQGRTLVLCSMAILLLKVMLVVASDEYPDCPTWMVVVRWFVVVCMICKDNIHINPELPGAIARRAAIIDQEDVRALMTREVLENIEELLAEYEEQLDEMELAVLQVLRDYFASEPPAMYEEEINAIPIYRYQKAEDSTDIGGNSSDVNELICCICLEQVNMDELVRRLHCSHEVATRRMTAPYSSVSGGSVQRKDDV